MNHNTGLESTTCGSLFSQYPSAMCSSLSYTGTLLDNPTPKAQELTRQLSQIIKDKNNPAPQLNCLNSDNNNVPAPTENPSQNQVIINVLQQPINITINLPVMNQDTATSNNNFTYSSLKRGLTTKDSVPWEDLFENSAFYSANNIEEMFNDNYQELPDFLRPLDNITW